MARPTRPPELTAPLTAKGLVVGMVVFFFSLLSLLSFAFFFFLNCKGERDKALTPFYDVFLCGMKRHGQGRWSCLLLFFSFLFFFVFFLFLFYSYLLLHLLIPEIQRLSWLAPIVFANANSWLLTQFFLPTSVTGYVVPAYIKMKAMPLCLAITLKRYTNRFAACRYQRDLIGYTR